MRSEYAQRRPRSVARTSRPYRSLYIIRNGPDINYREVVGRMLNGVDISLVEPALYPRLVPHIKYLIDHFESQHSDEYAVRELRYFLRYIEEEPHLREIEDMLKEPAPPPSKPPAMSEARVEAEVDYILRNERVKEFTPAETELVVNGLRQRRLQFIEQGDYLSAQKAEELARKQLAHGQLSFVESMQKSRVVELKDKLKEAEEELAESKRKWEALYEGLKNARQAEFDTMEQEHAKEIEDLEKWFNQPPPADIRKYSPALLQIRRREKAMLQTRNYAGAAVMKQQAEELEARENQKQLDEWHAKIRDRIRKCRERQARQVSGRRLYWAKEEQEMVRQANKEVEIAELQITHLKENVGVTVKARKIATELKTARKVEQTELPTMKSRAFTVRPKERDYKQECHQRRILNSKIYTRTPTRQGSPKTVRAKTSFARRQSQ